MYPKTEVDRGAWIQTFSKKRFHPLDPRPEDISMIDIAHHLSLICRFNGACREFYSVAQHSVLASRIVERYCGDAVSNSGPLMYQTRASLFALLHDAAEAYVGDITRPYKQCMKSRGFDCSAVERTIQRALYEYLEIECAMDGDEFMYQEIKRADNTALAMEARDLHSDWENIWSTWNLPSKPLPDKIKPVGPTKAREWFVRRLFNICPSTTRKVLQKEPSIVRFVNFSDREISDFKDVHKFDVRAVEFV